METTIKDSISTFKIAADLFQEFANAVKDEGGTFEDLRRLKEKKVSRRLAAVLMEGRQVAWPRPGEVFELTIDTPFPGLDMVRDDGYGNWQEWRFTGSEITVPETKRFELVEIGYQPNFEAVKRELGKHGTIPQGQWRKALRQKFSLAHGRLVGVADSSWVSPGGGVGFPYVHGGGFGYFDWAGRGFSDDWFWLVEVK